MIHFQGAVETSAASLYLSKLCRHFRHKVEVEFDEHQAQVHFPFGRCEMHADARQLVFLCQATDETTAGRIRWVLDDHLGRFARKEALAIAWAAPTRVDEA